MDCRDIRLSRHAFKRMFERDIPPEGVFHVAREGKIINHYPDKQPYPAWLLPGFWEERPIHLVLARDNDTGTCWIVTVYRPDPGQWDETFWVASRIFWTHIWS